VTPSDVCFDPLVGCPSNHPFPQVVVIEHIFDVAAGFPLFLVWKQHYRVNSVGEKFSVVFVDRAFSHLPPVIWYVVVMAGARFIYFSLILLCVVESG